MSASRQTRHGRPEPAPGAPSSPARRPDHLADYMGCCADRRKGHVSCGTRGGRTLSTRRRPDRYGCSSSRAGVWWALGRTLACRPERASLASERRRSLILHSGRDVDVGGRFCISTRATTLLVLLSAGGVGDVGGSCWSACGRCLMSARSQASSGLWPGAARLSTPAGRAPGWRAVLRCCSPLAPAWVWQR
jgi:hypothetical protein